MFQKIFLIASLIQCIGFISSVEFRNELQRRAGNFQHSSKFNNIFKNHDRNARHYTCFPPITCNSAYPYRSSDGTCNNLLHPYWGSSHIPFTRILTPEYGDGISSPRGSQFYPPLARPRDVSAAMVNTPIPTKNDGVSLMVMQFGQFTDHDLTFTPEDADERCCKNFVTSTPTSASCMPIDVTGDTFYHPKGVRCLPFVRSTASPCASGSKREQINDLTSYIDSSNVYGSTTVELTALREPNSYRMKFGPGRENTYCAASDPTYTCRTFLPIRKNNVTGANEFFAGDRRVEEQPGLTAMHNIPVRMHNDFAQLIKNTNSYLHDEEVFQRAKKLVNGVFQQITYNEFLPIVLGPDIMDFKHLTLVPTDAYNPYLINYYDEHIDVTTFSSFSTASFRFGHTLIKDIYTMKPNNIQVELAKSFSSHTRTTITGTLPSNFLWGIAVDPAEEADHILVSAVQNFLFAEYPFNFGQDLYARNIMRGRDHGLPPYVDFFNACSPGSIKTWDDLYKYIPYSVVQTLKSVYGGFLYDIDLFPAAMAETNYPGALLGPTFTCLNANFFYRAKFGDRFWFERQNYFSENQLRSIRRTRLSHILCYYTNAYCLPINVFLQESSYNPCVPCSELRYSGVRNNITTYW